MKLGFWLGGLTATVVAAQAVGCLGAAFVTTSGTGGGAGGGSTSTSTGNAGGATSSSSASSTSSGMPCTAPMTMCGSTCTDVSKDPANCKTCGVKCDPKAACLASGCGCAPGSGLVDCGATLGCVDITMPQHCGNNCTPCPHPNTDICMGGVCLCAQGGVDCGGNCADIKTDPGHCGGCGHPCDVDQACVDGTCQCRAGTTLCNGKCVDLLHDPSHCGSCGKSCVGTALTKCDDGNCALACVAKTECGAGGCYTDPELQSDPAHCGGCDKACTPHQVCIAGNCENYIVPPSAVCAACPCAACSVGDTCCPITVGPMPATTIVPACVSSSSCG